MKVLAVRADSGACARYRIIEPARVVKEQFDVDVRVSTEIAVAGERRADGLVNVNEVNEDVDLIIIQRPLNQAFHAMIEQAKKQGIATIVELDDHFDAIHPRNIAYRGVQPEHSVSENRNWLYASADAADLVTVSTPALADYYGRHGRSAVLRNYMPESALGITRASRSGVSVGWSGTLQTHPGDLEAAGAGVARGVSEAGASVYIVGDGIGIRSALQLSATTQLSASGWVPLEDYMPALADNIDVGIVPLENSTFNRAKSWLKGLEYATVGIPFVASNTPEYRLLAAYGIGEVAESPSDWRRHIVRWAKDGRRRTATAQKYRDIVRESLTYEVNAHQWLSAWEQAIENRKSAEQ